MKPTEQEMQEAEAQEAHAAPHAAPDAAQNAAPAEPKRRGRPLGARTNRSRTCLLSRLEVTGLAV